jgi:glycosyltransferase involved in cell wall biosynthesis
MPENDVAIYAPGAAALYERRPLPTGGAERQMALLAEGLTGCGLRVAQIVLPVADPGPVPSGLTLVQQRLVTSRRGPVTRLAQLRRVWSALAEADAEVYVFRSGLPVVGVGGLFCRARRRRLVFSSSNNFDFTLDFFRGRRPELRMYRFGVQSAAAVVVQSDEQSDLAKRAFPRVSPIHEIPSFAAPGEISTAAPEAFLWVGRLDGYKRPERYLDLARAMPEARFWMVCRRLDPERAGGAPGPASSPAMETEVEARAATLPNLEILEQRPHAEAMKLIDRAVAVVNTGPAEGMPNLFLEAWTRGVPVLSYEFDPDLRIARNELGAAAEGSAERFLEAGRRLWAGRTKRRDLSARLHAYVEATHGPEQVTRRWLEIIDEVRGG